MRQRIDKLRARCERLLIGGEAIQLEGEAVCIVYGVGLPRLGFGRSFLTNQRHGTQQLGDVFRARAR